MSQQPAPAYKPIKRGADAHSSEGIVPPLFPRTIGLNSLKYVQEVLDSGLSCDSVGKFEQAFAAELGVKHCIATPTCTTAMAALSLAFDFDPGDEVIISPLTDYGTVYGVLMHNYIPVFPDTAPGTVNFSAATIEPCITDRTRAILAVHKCGLPNDMDPINELAAKHGLIVYEDICQAIFSEYKGRIVGTLGTASAFSLDSEKTFSSDKGGCIATDDDELAEKVRFLSSGRAGVDVPHFGRTHTAFGHAYDMSRMTAALCLGQLETIRAQVAKIDRTVRLITEKLSSIDGITPLPIPDYVTKYSAWMSSFSIDPEAFKCTGEEFAAQVLEAGINGAGQGKYYLMPAALPFLQQYVDANKYPFSRPPASRVYHYSSATCPTAWAFLENWVRTCSISEKWEDEHVEMIAAIVEEVADRNRVG